MSTARIDSAIRTLVDLIYQQQTPLADPLALLPQWFEALRGLLDFLSSLRTDRSGRRCLSPGHRDDVRLGTIVGKLRGVAWRWTPGCSWHRH